MDFSSITGAVDLATVGVGILALAVIMMGPKVASYGAKRILGFFRG